MSQKAKVYTYTPVHVGTGAEIEATSYRVLDDETVARYASGDVLQYADPEDLLNRDILNGLSLKQPRMRDYQRLFDECLDHAHVKPLYTLQWLHGEQKYLPADVEEQVHDLHHPLIPGSTLKGAIWNSLQFTLLKKHIKNSRRELDNYFQSVQGKNGRNRAQIGYLFEVLGHLSSKDANELAKALRGCVLVCDVPFEEYELYEGKRIGSKQRQNGRSNSDWMNRGNSKKGNSIPTKMRECIKKEQTSEVKDLILVDEVRLQYVLNDDRWSRNAFVQEVGSMMNQKRLLECCSIFVKDVLPLDTDPKILDMYDRDTAFGSPTEDDISYALKNLKSQLEHPNPGTYYLRVGKGTTLFFKSIGYLIRKEYPDLYEKYFSTVFEPPMLARKASKDANLWKKIPVTREVLEDGEQYFETAGYIEISLC